MYFHKQFVAFKPVELRYLMNILHFVRDHHTKYSLAQNDVIAYVIAALESTEFVDPPPTTSNQIYDHLFDEFKTVFAY
jgi:hypothetical protein